MITDDIRIPPPEIGERPPRPRRHLVRRRQLPAGRAVVGGLLVAIAAVATIALSRSVNAPSTVAVVVAARTIEPGDPFDASVLDVVQMALPDELVERTFADPLTLDGTVARSRVEPGELLQHGDVIASTSAQRAAAPAREVAMRLDSDRAVNGRLEPGDRVDVIATYGTGVDAVTLVVLSDASVLAVDGTDNSIGTAQGVVLTLALADRADTVALAHAIDTAAVNVVRTTTAPPEDEVERTPYRPAHESTDDPASLE